jgi:hypothetical protein
MECSDKCRLWYKYAEDSFARACPFYEEAYCLYPAVHAFQMERAAAAAYKKAADEVEEKAWSGSEVECDEKGDKG